MITQKYLKELLHYDPETGVFTNRVPRRSSKSTAKVGEVAGWVGKHGYTVISLIGSRHLAHRLAWLYMTGMFPRDKTDHINGVRTDNRFSNLREATDSENLQNQKLSVRNTSGLQGVSFYKRDSNWRADICFKKARMFLGYFDTPEEAHQAYLTAKAIHHTFNPVPREAQR